MDNTWTESPSKKRQTRLVSFGTCTRRWWRRSCQSDDGTRTPPWRCTGPEKQAPTVNWPDANSWNIFSERALKEKKYLWGVELKTWKMTGRNLLLVTFTAGPIRFIHNQRSQLENQWGFWNCSNIHAKLISIPCVCSCFLSSSVVSIIHLIYSPCSFGKAKRSRTESFCLLRSKWDSQISSLPAQPLGKNLRLAIDLACVPAPWRAATLGGV